MSAPRLKTARLVLRDIEDRDIDVITRVAGNFDVSKWLVPVPHPFSRADAEMFVASVAKGEQGLVWAIEREGECIGLVGAGPTLGYWLCPEQWGQGIMSEAVAAVVDHWFETRTDDALPSSYFVGNNGSAGVLKANGFEDAGPSTSHSLARGCDVPSRKMLLTRARWSALRAQSD